MTHARFFVPCATENMLFACILSSEDLLVSTILCTFLGRSSWIMIQPSGCPIACRISNCAFKIRFYFTICAITHLKQFKTAPHRQPRLRMHHRQPPSKGSQRKRRERSERRPHHQTAAGERSHGRPRRGPRRRRSQERAKASQPVAERTKAGQPAPRREGRRPRCVHSMPSRRA